MSNGQEERRRSRSKNTCEAAGRDLDRKGRCRSAERSVETEGARSTKSSPCSSSNRSEPRRGVRRIASSDHGDRPVGVGERNKHHPSSRKASSSVGHGTGSNREEQRQRKPPSTSFNKLEGPCSTTCSNLSAFPPCANASASSRVKTGFDVDAPRKPLPRGAFDNTPESVAMTLIGLTDEQRAWAGIEEVLASGHDSIATRDVLPEEIIRAMMSSTHSFESTRFLTTAQSHNEHPRPQEEESDTSESENDDIDSVIENSLVGNDDEDVDASDSAGDPMKMIPGCPTNTEMPPLFDSSFSSMRSELSARSVRSVLTSNNYVLQKPNTAYSVGSMQLFMTQLITGEQQQGGGDGADHAPVHTSTARATAKPSNSRIVNGQTTCQMQQNELVEICEGEPPEREESIHLCSLDRYHDEDGKDEDGRDYGDESEEDDADYSRFLIQQYQRGDLPELMNASFSSVHTELTGMMSLVSTAKNYVVQADDINPMGVFLGNITRNLERKQEASRVESEVERVQYMSERDEIADERRRRLEEEVERYQSNNYVDYEANSNSMPSLASMREDENSVVSPVSRLSEEPPRDVKPPPPSDWRAWVDGAFQQAQSQVQAQAQAQAQTVQAQVQARVHAQMQAQMQAQMLIQAQMQGQSYMQAGLQNTQARELLSSSNMSIEEDELQEDFEKKITINTTQPNPKRKPTNKQQESVHDPFTDYYTVPHKDEEVISLDHIRVPTPSAALSPTDLPSVLPTAALPTTIKRNSSSHGRKKKDKYRDAGKSPLRSLKSKMSLFYKLGKGNRRGSPASVLDSGRGGEARFFPTIEEEEEEDWGTLLPN